MKKLLKTFSAAVILGTSLMGGVANAATCTGSIEVTGPGSNNQVNCAEVTNINVTCVNNVNVATVNYQNADSGDATSSINTSSGNAVTGSVVNDNGTDVQVGASCAPLATTTGGGGGAPGGGSTTPVEATSEQSPAGLGEAGPEELPFTAASPTEAIIVGSTAAAATVVGGSRLALVAYRRIGMR